MGKSPYLRPWYRLPSLCSAHSSESACIRLTLEPGPEPVAIEIPPEVTPLRNPYLSRGRQMGSRKKRSTSVHQPVASDKTATEAGETSVSKEKSGEANRLYLRSWYPA